MKLLIVLVCTLAAVSAKREIRPIEEYLLMHPERYVAWHKLHRIALLNGVGTAPEREGRIVGGNEAPPGQFPYQIANFVTIPDGIAFCGGSLIAPDVVLIAAHCVDIASEVKSVAGAHNITDENEIDQQSRITEETEIVVHGSWNPASSLSNDIAVILLTEPFVINTRVQVVVLPSYSDVGKTYSGQQGTTSGWGKDSDSSTGVSQVLRYVETEIMTNFLCNIRYFGLINAQKICGSGAGGKSSCNGDSGGPMVANDTGIIKQVGIVSFGVAIGCEVGWPHVYTRLTEYLNWIQDNTSGRVNITQLQF